MTSLISLLSKDSQESSPAQILKPLLLGGASGKEPVCNAGDIRDSGLIPGLGRSPGGGHGSPLQYSCLKNPMHRGDLWATVHRVGKSGT